MKTLLVLLAGFLLLPLPAYASIEKHPNTIGIDWDGKEKQTWTEFYKSDGICLAISNEKPIVISDNLELHKFAWIAHTKADKVEIKLHEVCYKNEAIKIREVAVFTSEGNQILPGIGRINCLLSEWRKVESEEDKAVCEKILVW